MEEKEIVNRVAGSGLVSINLEELVETREKVQIDIKDQLVQGLLLREKDFREYIKDHNWQQYQDKDVAVHCSSDALVPTWAFMLVAQALQPYAHFVAFGNLQDLNRQLFQHALDQIRAEDYTGQRVVIKGCSDMEVPVSAYVEITRKLAPLVKSIMYGEPCSTVPVFKKK
jgi:hypothetical protein